MSDTSVPSSDEGSASSGGYSASNSATQGDISQGGGTGGSVSIDFGDDGDEMAATEKGTFQMPAWALVAIALVGGVVLIKQMKKA